MAIKKAKSSERPKAAGKPAVRSAGPTAEETLARLLGELEPRFEELGARVAERVVSRLEESGLVQRLIDLAAATRAPAPSTCTEQEREEERGEEGPGGEEARTCAEPGCPEPARARGLCSKHYQRLRHAERREADPGSKPRRGNGACSVAGCAQTIYARGMCGKHFMEWVRTQKKG